MCTALTALTPANRSAPEGVSRGAVTNLSTPRMRRGENDPRHRTGAVSVGSNDPLKRTVASEPDCPG